MLTYLLIEQLIITATINVQILKDITVKIIKTKGQAALGSF
jgi:hypothetical protein